MMKKATTVTAKEFTEAVIRHDYACVTQEGHGHICYYGGYVAVLDGKTDYIRVYYPISSPMELMSAGLSASQVGVEYLKYWEAIHQSELDPESHIGFGRYLQEKERRYNVNAGRTALVLQGKYYVTKCEVDFTVLEKEGFKKDSNLFVPFSWDETYYEASANHNCNNCGAIRG